MTAAPLMPSPVWRRIAALVYDTLILLALSFLYGATITTIAVQQGSTPQEYQPMFQTPLFLMGWVLCLLSFYCWFWHKSGQTLGMRTWRLKLIQDKKSAQTPTWGQCLLRSLISPPAILLFGLGYWYSLINKDKNSLQDKLTKTRVIIIKKGA